MSVINKVLRELDQRHAISASADHAAPREVRPVRDPGRGHEWLWRIVAALLLVALAWVGWVVYQIQPRRVATDLGIAAGESARREPPRIVAEKTPAQPEPAASLSPPATDLVASLKLAQSIQTPIAAAEPTPEKPAAREPARPIAPPPPSTLKPRALSASAGAPRVEKHELTPAPVQRAETEFRRGTA